MTGLLALSSLQVALVVAIVGILLLVAGVRREQPRLVAAGYSAVYTIFALLVVSTAAMVYALVTHDFSVSYVAQVGSRATPLFFTIISLWGALEGSILFWAFLLAGFSALAVYLHRRESDAMWPYAAATLLGISVFFLVLLVGPANPFHVVSPVPADGPGPNPLLQNHPLMAVHPPLLYLGYVGFAVPFAFAVGAMFAGTVADDKWIRAARLWSIAAWAFLTAAIIAGMWWSYEVLGWGGYWAWDPVENASLMPWLTATAFLHSIMVQERRAMLKVWNLNLVVITFVLTVLGTFLTRSGILSSVHAFTQGTIGYYFLFFIAFVLVGSLALVAGHTPELRTKGKLDSMASRESAFMLNNLLLSVLTFTVLLGTLFPLIAEALRGIKVSVGAPFFNMMTLPTVCALLFLLGVGPALPWRRADGDELKRKLLAPAIGLVIGAVLAFAAGLRDLYAVLAFALGAFALVSNLQEFWVAIAARMKAQKESPAAALVRVFGSNRHRYGGYVTHLGVIAVAVGIAASASAKHEREVTLAPGQTVQVAGVTLRFDELWGRQEPRRFSVGADVYVLRNGRPVSLIAPRQHFYETQEEPVPTPAVLTSMRRDVYVNLMAFKEDGSSATIRVLVEPLVMWIWIGGLVACFGAVIALWPRRRGTPPQVRPVDADQPVARKRQKRKQPRVPAEVSV